MPRLTRALCVASALGGTSAVGLGVVENLVFAALSDWGGQGQQPFTTPGQLASAASLGRVADSLRPKFVLSAGGNFLPQGLPAGAQSQNSQTRFEATFEQAYSATSLLVPWYITSGFTDWEGNVTAEMAFNGSAASSDRWVYPNLWHTFTITLPPYEDTVQFIMIDTETLTSEQNQFPGWGNLPNLYYPPPVGQQQGPEPTLHAEQATQLQQAPQVQQVQQVQQQNPSPPPAAALLPLAAGALPLLPLPAVAAVAAVAAAHPPPPPPRVKARVAVSGAVSGAAPVTTEMAGRRLQSQGGAVGSRGAMSNGFGAGGQGAGQRRSGQRRLSDFDGPGQGAPISEAQWLWFQHELLNSTATWIVVVGNDPIWSAGEHGPTWTLAEKLLPMMEAAGVALYISGRDPIAQHITPSPSGSAVDFVGIGNGAYFNASQAAELPNELLCPDGALAWSYGASTGFLMVEVVNPTSSTPAALTATFYDDTGTVLYSFTKANPRAYKGYSLSPSNMRRTLGIMGALFLAVAACLCSVAGSTSKKSFTRGGPATTGPNGARYAAGPNARRFGATETTPLVLRQQGNLSNL